jgi:CheY-like chemotaxis protein
MNGTGKTILLVDDDADFAEAITAVLEAAGFRVLRAPDGRQALKLAKIERPDLVLMDIIMSERTEGFFAIQEFRHTPELRAVPIFVLSSLYSTVRDFQVAPESGWLAHDAFFSKPVDPKELVGTIRDRLGLGPAGKEGKS